MSRSDEQKEVERLLVAWENAVVPESAPATVKMVLDVIKICRVQQEEISEQNDRWRNISLGFRIVFGIGTGASIIIGAIAALIDLWGKK